MALPVVYRRKVGRDLAGTYGWYEDQRAGLGEAFLAAVDAAFTAKYGVPTCRDFRTLFSIASIPRALSCSRYFTRHVIRSSGHSQKAEPANRPIETDRFAAGHAERWASRDRRPLSGSFETSDEAMTAKNLALT